MEDLMAGQKLARDFQLAHEASKNRSTRPTSTSDILRDRLFIEKWTQLHRQGWTNATVVNFHLFPLTVNLGYNGYMTVPARKPGEPYTLYYIQKPKLDARDLGDARFIPEPVMPVELAGEFLREYGENCGGVLAYEGERKPTAEEVERALESQSAYYWREYNIGRDLWSTRKRHDLISERQRDAARALFDRGLVEKPEWMDRTVDKEDRKDIECEACGQSLKKGAKFCPVCHFVYDVQWVLANRMKLPANIVAIAAQANGPVDPPAQAPVDLKPIMDRGGNPPKAEKKAKDDSKG